MLAELGFDVEDAEDHEHDSTEKALSSLQQRLAEAEERIALLEQEEGEVKTWVHEWLANDAEIINGMFLSYEEGEEGDSTHAMSMDYPFGINGVGLPWVDLEADETADGMGVPPLLSVDFVSALGVEHEHLNGGFASCVQRGADGGVASIFTSAMGAIANSTGLGIFDLLASRIADAIESIDLECSLFAMANSTGNGADDVKTSLQSLTTAMSSPMPLTHVPHPCKHPMEHPPLEGNHSHPHNHRACLEEGEHVEALGGFGVHVEAGAVAAGETVTVPVEIVDPDTGKTFTINVMVSAQDATAVHVAKPGGKHAHHERFPNDEGEPESLRHEHDHDGQDFALIGMCLGGAALLISLVAASVLLRRRRAANGPAVTIAAPVGVGASGSSTTKADVPDSAVIVAMPGDLAVSDAVLAEVVAVPPVA